MTDLIRVREAAKIADVAPITIRRRIAEGVLPQYRRGHDHKVTYVRKSDLDRLMTPKRVGKEELAPASAA